jgi:Fe-S cluster biogenesis protein NfuA
MKETNNQELIQKIEKALDQVRPYLKKDGGDVEIHEITVDKVLRVRLTGSCENCTFSYNTLKAGIEMSVRHIVPEIRSVESV